MVDYQCPYFKIVKEDFISANGKMISWYLLKRNDYVTVIAKDRNYVYMVELYRFSVKNKSLEFPAGIIESNEKPLQAAKRELREEAGIIAQKFTYMGWHYAYIGMSDEKAHVFLAEGIIFGKQKLDESELGMKVKKIKISEIGNLIKKGKIRGEHTINAHCLYLLKQRKL